MRVAREIQSWGEGPTSRENPYRDSCTFKALTKQKKKALDRGRNKYRSVYSKGRKCQGSEKTALNKQREELGPNLLIVSFSSAKVTKHNEGRRVLPLLYYIEMLHFRPFFLVYTHPIFFTLNIMTL